MHVGSDGTEVTAAAIARLAGVGRAAVSNWRRRYADFPRPVGGTEASPAFSLAEVERWLRAQGKLAEAPPRERVRRRLEADPDGYGPALVRAGEHLAGLGAPAKPAAPGPLPESAPGGTGAPDATGVPGGVVGGDGVGDELGRELDAMARKSGAEAAFEQLLADYLDTNPRQYVLTPPATAALMARLAGPGDAVLDPACGAGALLAAAGAAGPDTPAALYGQDTDPLLARLAALRLADAWTTWRLLSAERLVSSAFLPLPPPPVRG
ncbi:N-6 DNA methylase, partial [Streptomyces diacarni]